MKLPEISKYRKPLGFVKPQYASGFLEMTSKGKEQNSNERKMRKKKFHTGYVLAISGKCF